MEEFLRPMGLSQNRLALNMGYVAADAMGERLIEEVKIRAKAGSFGKGRQYLP